MGKFSLAMISRGILNSSICATGGRKPMPFKQVSDHPCGLAITLRFIPVEVGFMGWGIFRILIFSSAFLIGSTTSGFWIPQSTVLEPTAGTSLVVTCEAGNPKVEPAPIPSGIEVKCPRSNMHVVRLKPIPPRDFKPRPFTPVASLLRPE